MTNALSFYIGGAWVEPATSARLGVENPSTAETFAEIALGSVADVDRAVAAARAAFPAYSATTKTERIALLQAIVAVYERRLDDVARAISQEIGAPLSLAREKQAPSGIAHFRKAIEVLETYEFEWRQGRALLVREPIGVAALITPWNWPVNQISAKVAAALASGSTVVLKPSELSPLSAVIFAEILHEAGVPAGVFNLVQGDGPTVGQALAAHPDVDMVSFTGSTRAGVLVAKAAAETVKRVHQELGGKSANILLPDADFEAAVARNAADTFTNSGQTCNAPTRLFVPRDRVDEAAAIAARVAAEFTQGPADAPGVRIGPVISGAQFDRIQALIASGLDEGARLVAGGPGRPEGLSRGWFVRPTVFADVQPAHRIAREEIFGPVLSILGYDSVEQAITLANDTVYGLAAYVQSRDIEAARAVARRLRAGVVYVNGPAWDPGLPFGGFKQSGNGREYGVFGLEDFTELKAISGYDPA